MYQNRAAVIVMQTYAKYVKRARELGAKHAKPILAKSVIAAEWVRIKCQFGCDGYGQCLTCPPHSPKPAETRAMLKYYKKALLIHGDEKTDVRSIVATLEKEIFLDGYFKAFGMGAGPCFFCNGCAKSCRHADKARPSLEACGIDVYTTVRNNGFPINVVRTQNCKGNYYGIVLIE